MVGTPCTPPLYTTMHHAALPCVHATIRGVQCAVRAYCRCLLPVRCVLLCCPLCLDLVHSCSMLARCGAPDAPPTPTACRRVPCDLHAPCRATLPCCRVYHHSTWCHACVACPQQPPAVKVNSWWTPRRVFYSGMSIRGRNPLAGKMPFFMSHVTLLTIASAVCCA